MIEIKNLTKEFYIKNKKIVALEDLNLKIPKNKLTILKGPSGSGKSTLLSLIAGISKPSKGTIFIKDTEITKLPEAFASDFRIKNIGFIFQKFNLIENLDVFSNVSLPLIPINLDKKVFLDKINFALEIAKISHKKDIIVSKLSGGEQQRVAIARALVSGTDLILADEPTANLDKDLTNNFINILKDLKKLNKTIILATHDDIFFNLDIVDNIIELNNGNT